MQSGQRRPELIASNNFRHTKAKALLLYCLSSVRRKVVIVLYFAILIKFQQANYLTFGGLLSRNAGDFLGSVGVGVDFCEYLSVWQSFEFQISVK